MKIILAGFPKTGTKSIAKALRILGYNVYDVQENLSYLGDTWLKILTEGYTEETFFEMYKNVDATTDVPVVYYWEELYKVFPHAKVILMVRENEKVWSKSMVNQLHIMANSFIFSYFGLLSSASRKVQKFINLSFRITLGLQPLTGGKRFKVNEQNLRIAYRNHNTRVIQVVPKNNLLIYECREGWGSLCRFLDCKVPKGEFPHENKNGEFGKEKSLQNNPGYIQIKRETKQNIFLILFTLFLLFAVLIVSYL